MRSLVFLACIALAACTTSSTTTSIAPEPEKVVSQPTALDTRTMTFRADVNDVQVVANCTVRGPEFNVSFDTPASVDIPIDSSGRALISFVSCDVNGQRAEANDLPGPETTSVEAVFGGTGLFGDKALVFGPRLGRVQYFVRSVDEGVIRVAGAPEP